MLLWILQGFLRTFAWTRNQQRNPEPRRRNETGVSSLVVRKSWKSHGLSSPVGVEDCFALIIDCSAIMNVIMKSPKFRTQRVWNLIRFRNECNNVPGVSNCFDPKVLILINAFPSHFHVFPSLSQDVSFPNLEPHPVSFLIQSPPTKNQKIIYYFRKPTQKTFIFFENPLLIFVIFSFTKTTFDFNRQSLISLIIFILNSNNWWEGIDGKRCLWWP